MMEEVVNMVPTNNAWFWVATITLTAMLVVSIFFLVFRGKIAELQIGKVSMNFVNAERIKERQKEKGGSGEDEDMQSIRLVILRQYLYIIEFCKRFHTLCYAFCTIAYNKAQNSSVYPNLNNYNKALEMFKDFSKNRKFEKVISWDDDRFIKDGTPTEYYHNKLNSKHPPFESYNDNKNLDKILNEYDETSKEWEQREATLKRLCGKLRNISSTNDLKAFILNLSKSDDEAIAKLFVDIDEINNVYNKKINDYSPKDREYLADICEKMETALRFWNNKLPRILNEEAKVIIAKVEETLTEWYLRNDIPLDNYHLRSYLETHVDNLQSTLHQTIIEIYPNYSVDWMNEALASINDPHRNIQDFIKDALKEFIISLQFIRFNKNLFLVENADE